MELLLRADEQPGGQAAAWAAVTHTKLPGWQYASEEKRKHKLVAAEHVWRAEPSATGRRQISIGRWNEHSFEPRQYSARRGAAVCTIEIHLSPTVATFTLDGKIIQEGSVPRGSVQITPAGCSAHIEFRAPCDVIHLFVPSALLADYCARVRKGRREAPLVEPHVFLDPVIEGLAGSLIQAQDLDDEVANIYADGITSAILARLASTAFRRPTVSRTRQGLVKWRLSRVIEYVETNLASPIRLDDLAQCAGLSRMHFAAQFKATTGTRPHNYVLRRRIERAQELLRSSHMPLVEIALEVGFQTQAHFTTIFRQLVCETPGRWRDLYQGKLNGAPLPLLQKSVHH